MNSVNSGPPTAPLAPVWNWGKMNLGQSFNMTGQDIDRAISCAGLGKLEAILLTWMREHCWTTVTRQGRDMTGQWRDAASYLVDISALAREVGVTRQAMQKAKRNLVRSHILFEDEEDHLRINKNAHEWLRPKSGEPRLSRAEIQFCTQAQPKVQATFPCTDRAAIPAPKRCTKAVPAATVGLPLLDSIPRNPQAAPPAIPKLHPPQSPSCTPRNPQAAPPAIAGLQAPIEDRGRELDFQKTSEESQQIPPLAGEIPLTTSPSSEPQRVPGHDLTSTTERTELTRLATLAIDYFPDRFDISQTIRDRDGSFPVVCYAAALERLRERPRFQHNRNYFLGIVRGLATDGLATDEPVATAPIHDAKVAPIDPRAPRPVYRRDPYAGELPSVRRQRLSYEKSRENPHTRALLDGLINGTIRTGLDV